MKHFFSALLLFFTTLAWPANINAQTAALHGQVQDPSGAVIPGAAITLTGSTQTLQSKSSANGQYAFRSLTPGSYTITVTAKGFSPLTMPGISLVAGQSKELNLPLAIHVENQEVTVEGQNQSVSLSPDQNAGAIVLKGSDLEALSDDPDELQNELQALAGPAAGPNGGQIYIDGFEGGQIPPKSSILEVRVNQNPFSAEFDRIGYGRIEIITKPGSQKLKGSINAYGIDSALNTANPFLAQQLSYYRYGVFGDLSGPLTKTSAYFFHANRFSSQNQTIVNATDPQDLSAHLVEAFPTPNSYLSIGPRIDFQLGKKNMFTLREAFYRLAQSGSGVGTLSLPSQATNGSTIFNELQMGDTIILSPRLLSEVRFVWDRTRTSQTPASFRPTVTVQGAFTTGGSGVGNSQNHSDQFVVQDHFTATAGAHAFRFGARLRAQRDANYSQGGINGSYFFGCALTSKCANSYQSGNPEQYTATVIANPLARATVLDASLFFQDDWRWKPNLMMGFGLRYETQNWINDHADFAPRVAIAWSPGRTGKVPAKTVIRAGYGWFYNRFTGPTAYNGGGAVPYIIQVIHDNLINQRTYTVSDPNAAFPAYPFDPANPQPIPVSALASAPSSIPTEHTVDPHFHAALDMQAGIGVDRQLAKKIMGNITYLYTQGVHQYLTNNVTAPGFDVADYTTLGPAPSLYNYQYQSGGFYRQNQLIFSSSIALKHLTLNGNYTLNQAKSDTQGVNSFPSIAQDPGFDYGRASFDVRHRFTLIQSYTAPHGIVIAALLAAQSGTPYNLTIGTDPTGNNQFNARPTYGVCGATGVVSTRYGCLDTDPDGKHEAIVPYGIGTGPANAILHVRISKVIGIGPRIKQAGEGNSFTPGEGGSVSGRGLSGGGASIRLDASAPRRYNLTFVAGANNLLNMVNLGPPNGVLLSPLFNQTQSLAGGQFGSPTPGNRTIVFQSSFSF